MIISNSSDHAIAIRWNEYMNTYIADATRDGKTISFPLRAGEFVTNDITVRVDVPDECNRFNCDMKQSEIYFS